MFKRKKNRFRIFDKDVRDALFGVGTIGMHLVGSTFIGLAMGYYLDKWLDPKYGTKPYLTFFFLFMGIVAGFRNVYFEARRLQRMNEKNAVPPPGPQKPEGKEKPYGYTPAKGDAEDANKDE
ncbi:ATP synthase subunit [Oceanidesulfovibrio indonesiensis]|uniref:ATP synthase subunit n=2 Tax=Oceanidesulfovibrio indonesiensis TaxID=54767 RepID=A0A7M3MDP5_9BACT|nr:ATP synthase subunit [Oceanidesulfovibrio indonesiensis]